MTEQPLEYYIDRYVQGIITPEEIAFLRQLLNKPEHSQQLDRLMEEELKQWEVSDSQFPEVLARVQQGVAQRIAMEEDASMPLRRSSVLRVKWYRYAAAAVIVLGLGLTAYFLTKSKPEPASVTASKEAIGKDIAPGKNGAILTLADGSQMVLDSINNGVIARQQGAKVVVNRGKLIYDQSEVAVAEETVYNIMSTPKGRQYEMTLPDGTRVWLNAASSIRFPVQFTGDERKVFITGEAYFDVTKNDKMPFRVDVNNRATIEVLGTKFNVNAYDDEPDIRTTLESGTVKVLMAGNGKILKPGQQAKITDDGEIKLIDDPDMLIAMSWRTNKFQFYYTKLDAALRQLARWYDVEVIYENNKVPNMEFTGDIRKTLSLSKALLVLNKLGVKFRIEGQKLTVMN